jgi:hypothetical protein
MAVTSLAAPVLLEYLAKTQNSRETNDYWVVKLDENRNIIWDKTYGGTGVDQLHIQTTDGGYLREAHQTLIFQLKRPIIHAEILIYGSKIDQSGNIMWQKNI